MKYTIVLPSFNHGEYIEFALKSCYEQSYDEIELVISDDCSTDDSQKIIEKITRQSRFKSRFTKIHKIFNSKNLGSYGNIFTALSYASGSLISILNTDDYFDHRRVEEIVKAVDGRNNAWGFTGVNPINNIGDSIPQSRLPPTLSDVFSFYEKNLDVYGSVECMLLARNIAISSGNLFFTKQYIKLFKYFSDFKYCGDWGFVLCASYLNSPIYLEEKLLHYRIHDSNSFSGLKSVGEAECDKLAILAECLFLSSTPKNEYLLTDSNLDKLRKFYLRQRPALSVIDRQTIRGPMGIDLLTNFDYVNFSNKIRVNLEG